MMISRWRLPEELGGAVVNPVRCEGVISAQARYSVQVPGTSYRIYVPSECLVPMLPEEPPVNSVVLVLGKGHNWQLYVRQSTGLAAKPGRWAAPGNTGIVHTWQMIHQDWDKVHVLLWWDKDKAEGGAVADGIRPPSSLVVGDVAEDEPGVVLARVTGTGARVFLGREEALKAAAALLGLALKELM